MSASQSVTLRVSTKLLEPFDLLAGKYKITRSELITAAMEAAVRNEMALQVDQKISAREKKRRQLKALKDKVREANAALEASRRNHKRAGYAMNSFDMESQMGPSFQLTPRAKAHTLAREAYNKALADQKIARQALVDAGFTGQVPGEPSAKRIAAAKAGYEKRRRKAFAAEDLAETIRINERN